MTEKRSQRGAALVIVLLLVATLSFVLLSLTTIVTTGVRRGANERARTEMLWRALAAERIAASILEKAKAGGALKTASSEGGLYSQQLKLPLARGAAELRFADASRCFNVNSLISEEPPYAKQDDELQEFLLLLEAIGAGDSDAQEIAGAIVDFIDDNNSTESQGSEDNFYTGLTTPFRTPGGPVASISELRAVQGVTREIYAQIAPYLCARGAGQKIEVNLNALTPEDAPVVYALAKGNWPLADIRAQIAASPPGGWTDPAAFWTPSPGGAPPAGVTTGLESSWIEARVLLEAEARFVEETLIFAAPSSGKLSLYSRVLGGRS